MPEHPIPRSQQSLPPAAPLVGREREQQVLRDHLRAAAVGCGSLVLVSGEAGIGKTSLIKALEREATTYGALVLTGASYDLASTPPYGPWLEIMRAYPNAADMPRLPDFVTDAADLASFHSQEALFEHVVRFFHQAAAVRPLVLILEDLHWSDPASLDLLRYLARRNNAPGALLIVTYRADELARQHPLFQLLPLLVREAQAQRIDVRALTDDDVLELVRHRYTLSPEDERRLVAYLQSRAEGNPFYLGELLLTLEAERLLFPAADGWLVGSLEHASVPLLVRQVVEGRLARLDADTRRLLEVAAVIGQEVPIDVWLRVSDAHGDQLVRAIERASDAHLILETPGTTSIRFTHALLRETLYLGLVLPHRQMLHRRVAEVLAERPDVPISVVASHFGQADDPRAIDWLLRAGERALALYAAHDAIAALTRAQDLAARFAQDLPLTAYHARASAYTLTGEFDQARRDHEIVLERGRATGDRRTEWRTLIDLGMLWAERDYERTNSYYRAALDLARTIGDKPMIAHSLNHIANWHVNQDEPEIALPLHQEALNLFEECGDRSGIAGTLDLLGLASFLNCDWLSSTRYWERSITLLRELDDRQRLSSGLAMLAGNGGTLDCDIAAPVYREATFWIANGEEGLAIAREINWPAGEAFALFMLSLASGARGDLGRALHDAEAALEIAGRIGHRQWTVFARYVRGAIWKELLDPKRAMPELEQALALARMSGARFLTNTVATTLASVQIEVGDLDRAAAMLGTIGRSDTPGPSMAQRQCWFVQGILALARGEAERTLTIVDQLSSTSPKPSPEHGIPQLSKLRGDALARLRRYDDAEQDYLSARHGAALLGFHPLLWRVDVARGALYQAKGRTAAAEEAFGSARITINELAKAIPDESTREHFREQALAYLPVDQSSERSPASATQLSPRELDVLRLLVVGQTDREIAEALSISPRTVMRHVTNILNKLGVSSRTAAATLAIRHNIV